MPSQDDLEIVSTSPSLPTSDLVESFSVTFNRVPSGNEISQMSLTAKDTSSSSEVTYVFFNGLIQTTDTPPIGIGTYEKSGETINCTLHVSKYITSFSV